MANNNKLSPNAKAILALADRHYNEMVDIINSGNWEDNQLLHLMVQRVALDAATMATEHALKTLTGEL